MSDDHDRILLTDEASPIYHNPNPTDEESIEFKQRWKGYCLYEFYETSQLKLFEETPKNELSRHVVVWDGSAPISFIDGIWIDGGIEGWVGDDAILAPGTSEEVREAFRAWVQENTDNRFGIDSLNINQKVVIEPQNGTLQDARHEMETLFDSFLQEGSLYK